MTEIEQLRADIATLEAAIEMYQRKHGYHPLGLKNDSGDLKKQLAKLEKEAADPWRRAKAIIPLHLASGGHNVKVVAAYAVYLQAMVDDLEEEVRCERIDGGKVHADLKTRIAELEAELLVSQNELAKRPAVWCVLREGGYMRRRCGCIKTFTDRDRKSSLITQANFKPYTGELQ